MTRQAREKAELIARGLPPKSAAAYALRRHRARLSALRRRWPVLSGRFWIIGGEYQLMMRTNAKRYCMSLARIDGKAMVTLECDGPRPMYDALQRITETLVGMRPVAFGWLRNVIINTGGRLLRSEIWQGPRV